MTTKKQLDIINKKLDLSLKAVAMMPLFIAACSDKNPRKTWKEAVKQWEKIDKEYEKILRDEYNCDTASVEDKVS